MPQEADAIDEGLDEETRFRRLQALGFLATTMAHELNNLNMVVTGNLELIQQQPTDPGNAELVRKCRLAAWRGADVLRSLLGLVGGPIGAAVPLGDLLEQVRLLLRGRFDKEGVELRVTVAEDLATDADGIVVAQVLFALLTRACTAAIGGRDKFVVVSVRSRADELLVEIVDTGSGLDERQRAYEHDATVSPRERLRELDEAQCRSLLAVIGGGIAFQHEVGRGSTVSVTLPRHGARKGGLPLVLVIDDEEIIGELVFELLRDEAEVRVACDVAGGVALLDGVDLVLTDLHLPDGQGQGVVDALRAAGCRAPIVIMSGTVIVGDAPEAQGWREVSDCLAKPFGADELSRMVAKFTRDM